MIRLLSWLLAKGIDLAIWVLEDTGTDRGEVAGVPEVEDIPQVKSLDEACALTRPIAKRPPDYPTTPAERRFADDVENWLRKENAA